MRNSVSIGEELRTKRWLLLIILVTVAIGVVGVLMARRVRSGAMDRGLAALTDGVLSPPSRIGPLLSGNTRAEVGDMVFLNDVRATPGPKAQVFVVSGAQGNRMLVVSEAGAMPMAHSPITVDIKGRIRRLPSSSVLRKQWKLHKDEVRAFGEQEVYIAAESMKEQIQETN